MTHGTNTSGPYSIAVAGGTGNIGKTIIQTALSPLFLHHFGRIVAFGRDPTSPSARELEELGVEVYKTTFDPNDAQDALRLRKALNGVDILVNTLHPSAAAAMDILAKAAVDAGVKVYFPSEFGVDRSLVPAGVEHPLITAKEVHVQYVKQISKGTDLKIILLDIGLFVEGTFLPWLGFNIDEGAFTIFGSSNTRTAYTTKEDISRSLLQASLLALSPDPAVAASVPETLLIAGSNRSPTEIKAIVEHAARNDGKERFIVINELDWETERNKLKKDLESGKDGFDVFARFLQAVMGSGVADASARNDNELVNPGESLWKWTSVNEYFLGK